LDPEFPVGRFTSGSVNENIARRVLDGKGYYKWRFTRLLLWEFEEALRGTKGFAEKVSWERCRFDETIEHIFPQNPERDERKYWNQVVPIHGNAVQLRTSVCNSLGNLLLLSGSRN